MTTITPCLIETPADSTASYEAAISENPANSPNTSSGRNKRSIGKHTKYWAPGRTLKIAISDYDDGGFEIVKNAIKQWLPYVNLTFEFVELVDDEDLYEGDIRIYLSRLYNGTGRSALGTDARATPATEPTLLLGTNYTSIGYEALVIHEFGHALGLTHEHQHPDATIPWNRENTYRLYKQNFGWSKETVDKNIFPLPRNSDQTYTAYDRHSIMHYQVLNICTIGDWEQPENRQLSAGDKAFARQIYP